MQKSVTGLSIEEKCGLGTIDRMCFHALFVSWMKDLKIVLKDKEASLGKTFYCFKGFSIRVEMVGKTSTCH